MKHINILLFILILMAESLWASSHREAPLIANDPLADNTDVYAFRSPDNPDMVTLIASYVPFQLPHGGPNYYGFGENIRYEIHVDNNVDTPGDDIIYRFTFKKEFEDPSTFFYIRLGQQNHKTTYTLEKSMDGGATFTTVIENGVVPPNNIGERSITGAAGLNTTYEALFNNAITTASSGEKVFCGPTDDPFFVDLGGIFDLGDAPRQNGTPRDGVGCLNVSTIALQVPISILQKDGQSVDQAENILDSDYVIGVWASASRRQIRTLDTETYEETFGGDWVQVSRLGMPLTNEAVIPIGFKDLWNATTPYDDLANLDVFGDFFYNPELSLYMDDSLFGGAVPAFAPLRVQRNSLQSFDFGFGQDGLFGLKGSDAVEGTALDDDIFGALLLPGEGSPRSVDLWPIFHTGVPNLAPYQLATGKGGNPLAEGKPFINNFLPNGGDMLRLNMAVPPTPRDDPNFSTLGIVQAAVLGLTDPTYAGNSDLEFIPNMDGFPNGRRLEDDVTRIELQAVSGVALAAIGLWYDDYTAGDANPVTQDLLDVLTYTTGVEANDTSFRSSFPYVQMPWSGTGKCSGEEVEYTQPDILPPTQNNNPPMARCKKILRVNLGPDATVTIDPSDVDNGSTADAGIASLELSQTTFGCPAVIRYNNVTLTVTDNDGNTDECKSLIRVSDQQPLPDNYVTNSIGQSTGESFFSACSNAIEVKTKKTGSRVWMQQDWSQFTNTRLTGDFTLSVKTTVQNKFAVAGVMVRTNVSSNAEMAYAGISTVNSVRNSSIEIGERDRNGGSMPEVKDTGIPASGQLGTTFRIERRGDRVKFFDGNTLLFSRWFRQKSLLVGFFTTARSNFTVSGNFTNIDLRAFGGASNPNAAKGNSTLVVTGSVSLNLNLWPNPVGNILNVKFNESVEGEVTLEVVDLIGRQILRQTYDNVYEGDNIELELAGKNLRAGAYLLKVTPEDGAPFFKEFVKMEQ